MKINSHCPINFALVHFGDKWSLLILRDLMFKEKRYYNEFLSSEEKVSTSVLGDRLKSLEKSGLIFKQKDTVKKSRIKYSLTEKGIDLLPMMVELIIWSSSFDKSTVTDKEFLSKISKNKPKLLKEIMIKLKTEHKYQ